MSLVDNNVQDLSDAVANLRLPPKQSRTKKGFQPARTEKVAINCHAIELEQPSQTLHQYEFHFIIDTGSKDEARRYIRLWEGAKNDVRKNQRRELLGHLWREVRKANEAVFGREPTTQLFDYGAQVVTRSPLNLSDESTLRITISGDSIDSAIRSTMPKRVNEIFVEIKALEPVVLDLTQLAADEFQRNRNNLSTVELIFNQKLASDSKFTVFPHTSYLRDQKDAPVVAGYNILEGLAKGARVGVKPDGKVQLLLQTKVTAGAFFPDCPLIDFLLKHLNARDIRDIERNFKRPEELKRECSKLKKILRHVVLRTTHLQKNKEFVCDDVTREILADVKFSSEERDEAGVIIKQQRIAVVDYFERRYRVRTKCKYLPGIIESVKYKDEKQSNVYPMDVLTIVGGQRLSLQKTDSKTQVEVVKAARKLPEELKESTARLMKSAFITPSNPFARKFGMKLNEALLETQADQLFAPSVSFAQNATVPVNRDGTCNWRAAPQKRKFVSGGRADNWMVFNYNRCCDDSMINEFINRFVNLLNERGAAFTREPKIVIEGCEDRLIDEVKHRKVEFVVVITKDKMDPIHDRLKHFEASSGVITQHLALQTVRNVVQKNQNITLDNIIMKTNEKCGGLNMKLTTNKDFAARNRSIDPAVNEIYEKKWIADRLFIGIDLSHSAPGARQSPTVVGLCYNHNEDLGMTGYSLIRDAKKTIVSTLQSHIVKIIEEYKQRSKAKKWPSHIIVYRVGVSDNEVLQVTAHEKSAFKEAMNEVTKKDCNFRAGLTILIAQKNNTRLYPTGPPQPGKTSPSDLNVKPGIAIFSDSTSPTHDQFTLVAQRALMGTARPITYTVVVDESPTGKRIDITELANLTYGLCHISNVVMGTVTLPTFLHHAGQVAKRGRNNMKFELYGTVDDNATISSNGQVKQEEQDATYLNSIEKRLQVTNKNKYWC